MRFNLFLQNRLRIKNIRKKYIYDLKKMSPQLVNKSAVNRRILPKRYPKNGFTGVSGLTPTLSGGIRKTFLVRVIF